MMMWGWPQWAIVIWFAFVLIASVLLDGRDRTGKHSFAGSALSIVAFVWVLWMGGFFE